MPALTPIEHLATYGYCVLENRVSGAFAEETAERLLKLHDDPRYRSFIDNHSDKRYQTLFGVVNLEERVWSYAAHADVLAVVRHFLGEYCRMAEAASKPNWPGAKAGGLHVDSGHNFQEVPNVPWLINTMWMLTDFTVENGATGVVPLSHHACLKSPPSGLHAESESVKPVTGSRGSVMLWHGGLFHCSRANTSNQIRMGLNVAYYPRWYNHWNEASHQPVWPETFERMPAEMRRICPGRLGKNRADLYEDSRR